MARTKQTARKKWGSKKDNNDDDIVDLDANIKDSKKREKEINKFLKENDLLEDDEDEELEDKDDSFEKSENYRRMTDLCILLQEFSRRSMTWPLINIGKFVSKKNRYEYQNKTCTDIYDGYTVDIPTEVLDYLMANECMILAGGSVSDMIKGSQRNDYDLFCIEKRPIIKTDGMIETINSYTTIEKPKIQIIKRIYSRPEEVIGGFDLEPSKFFMNSNLEVYCTVGALISLEHGINPINFNSYSSSFVKRINKYQKKGFMPIYVNKKREMGCVHTRRYRWRRWGRGRPDSDVKDLDEVIFNDYTIELSNVIGVDFQEKIFRINFACLIRNEPDGYCIANGVVIPKEKFIEKAKLLYNSENTGYLRNYFNQRHQIIPKYNGVDYKKHLKFMCRRYHYGQGDLAKYLFNVRIENIEKNYSNYTAIVDRFRISNPGSQHTSSFHPVELKTLNDHYHFKKKFFGPKFVKRDHSTPGIKK